MELKIIEMDENDYIKESLTRSSDLSLYMRENDWYSFSGRGYLWKIGWKILGQVQSVHNTKTYDIAWSYHRGLRARHGVGK